MATSKLTRVLKDGFSKSSARVLFSSKEIQPLFLLSIAACISERISSALRSDIESKCFPLIPVSPIFLKYSTKTGYSIGNKGIDRGCVYGIIIYRYIVI